MKVSLDPSFDGVPPKPSDSGIEQLLRRTAQVAGLSLLGVAATMLFLHWTTRLNAGWTSRARDAGRLARQVQLLADDRETSVRAYLITGNPVSLTRDSAARSQLGPRLDSLAAIVAADKELQAEGDVAAIRRALARWDSTFADPVVSAAAAGRPAPAPDSLAGKLLFDDVRETIGRLGDAVDGAYAQHLAASRRWEWVADAVLLAEVALLILGLHSMRRRISQHTRELAVRDADLEAQNATLRDQHHMLNEQAAELEVQALELEEANHNLELAMESVRDAEAEARGLLAERDALLSAVTDVALVVDAEGRCIRVPPIDQPMLGRPAAELVGMRVTDVLAPEMARALLSAVRRALDANRRVELEYSRTIDGELVWRSGIAAPIGRGEVLWIARDITASKRTRLRLEDQVRQSQKMEAIGRLAGGVAHDFNNLLAVIRGYASILQTDVSDPELREPLDEIVGAADRATTLTRQLLLFSRHRPADPEPIDLNAAVDGLTTMLSSLIGAHIDLMRDLSAAPLVVAAERSQLDQVIVNLMVNARDAMPEGGRVTISTRPYDVAIHGDLPSGSRPPTDYAVLAVTDTGIGMDAATRSQIFEPFFTTKQEGKGTGIGLSTVYAIVQQAGGFLRVESAPNAGSRFEVVLPLATNYATAPGPAARAPLRRGNESVLIVEDQTSLRVLLRRWLEGAGYVVYEAENGRAGLEVFQKHRNEIAVVITDVVMPVLGGRQLAEALADLAPALPVVFMSGFTGDFPIDGGTSQILEMFLQKPFTREELLARIRDALDRADAS